MSEILFSWDRENNVIIGNKNPQYYIDGFLFG